MKRTIALVLSACMLLTAAAGCSNSGGSGENSQPADSSKTLEGNSQAASGEPVEIEIWTVPDWKGVYSSDEEGADYLDFLNFVAEEFHKENENVTITPVLVDSATRAEKMSIAIQSNELPNMFYESYFALGDYVHEGIMVPLDDIFTEEDLADIPKAIIDGVSVGGHTYIFPFSAVAGMMGINVSLVKQAGAEELLPETDDYGVGVWSPEEFRALLEAVAPLTSDGVYPYALYANSQQGDTLTNMMLRMYGGEFVNEEGTAFAINSDAGVKAMEFLAGLVNDKLIAPGGETLSQGDTYEMFLNKTLVVTAIENTTRQDLVVGLENGSISDPFEFMWAYYPSDSDAVEHPFCHVYVKGGAVFDTGDQAEIDASKQFVKFFSSAPYTEASKVLSPVRLSVQDEIAADPDFDPYMVQITRATANMMDVNNSIPGYISARAYYYPEMQAIITGQKEPKAALDDFVKNANDAVADAISRSTILNP